MTKRIETEKQFHQSCCEILDFLHVHGDSTRKQIAKAVRLSECQSNEFLENLIDAELVKQVWENAFPTPKYRAVR